MRESLQKLRVPFAQNQISYLPKGGIKVAYVGHAALTDRLLDVDPAWAWEPLALGPNGLPVLDECGGLWIRLTICGVTRLGYGDAGTKKGGDAMKERIGDALRNAAMRFGAALDLWHKGDLHGDEDQPEKPAVRDAGGVISGPREVLRSLPPDWQAWLSDFAPTVENAFEQQGAAAAQTLILDAKLDNEVITGLYSLLSSKARSALKTLPRLATV